MLGFISPYVLLDFIRLEKVRSMEFYANHGIKLARSGLSLLLSVAPHTFGTPGERSPYGLSLVYS
jgi:hypothetical protein